MFLIAVTDLGCSKRDKKPPETQCRVVVLLGHDPISESDWIPCDKANKLSEELYDKIDVAGTIILTEERTKEGKDWSKEKLHSYPLIIPKGFDTEELDTT